MANDDSGTKGRSYTGIPAIDIGDSGPVGSGGEGPTPGRSGVVQPGDTPESMERFTKSFGIDPDAIPEDAKMTSEPTKTASKSRNRFFETLSSLGEAANRLKLVANRKKYKSGGESDSEGES